MVVTKKWVLCYDYGYVAVLKNKGKETKGTVNRA